MSGYLQYSQNNAQSPYRGNGKRKKDYASGGETCGGGGGKQRNQANARERDRTHSVNSAFSTLRTLIPTEPKDRKLSKIETLRLASSYISHLGTQLLAGPIDQPCLRLSKADEESNCSRHAVCTFCIAHHKKGQKRMEDYEYTSNYDASFCMNSAVPPSAIFTSTDLTAIYY